MTAELVQIFIFVNGIFKMATEMNAEPVVPEGKLKIFGHALLFAALLFWSILWVFIDPWWIAVMCWFVGLMTAAFVALFLTALFQTVLNRRGKCTKSA